MGAEAAGEGGEGGEGAGEKMVPSSRLREETAARRAALARVSEVEAELAAATKRIGTADTLAKRVGELEGELKLEREDRAVDRAVYGSGITDPEGVDQVRYHYGRLPEKDRPPVSDWLKSVTADPAKAPKSLQPFLPAAAGKASTATAATTRATGGATGAAAGSAGNGAPMSAEAIKAIRAECERTGDWAPWKAARPQMMAALGTTPNRR